MYSAYCEPAGNPRPTCQNALRSKYFESFAVSTPTGVEPRAPALPDTPYLVWVPAFDGDAYERFGAGGAQYDAATATQGRFHLTERALHFDMGDERGASRDTYIEHDLRKALQLGADIGQHHAHALQGIE